MMKVKDSASIKGDTYNRFPEPFKYPVGKSECKGGVDFFGLTMAYELGRSVKLGTCSTDLI